MKTKRTIFLTLLFTLFILIVASCDSDEPTPETLDRQVWVYSSSVPRTDSHEIYGAVFIFRPYTCDVFKLDYKDKIVLHAYGHDYKYHDGKLYLDTEEYDISDGNFTYKGMKFVKSDRKSSEFFR